MLSDYQKEQLSAEIIPMFQDLEQDTIQDIARRLRKEKRWTESAELQAKALESLGHSPSEIQTRVLDELHADKDFIDMMNENTLEHKKLVRERIRETVDSAQAHGDKIIGRAGDMSFADDVAFWKTKGQHLKSSPALKQISAESSKRLEHELKSLTHSTGFKFIGAPVSVDQAFNHSMDKAVMNVASGAFSSEQAVEQVVSELEKSGLRYVNYASGITRGIDVAAHLAVRTTLNQMAADISMSNAEQLGTDLVEVSSHGGARDGDGHANHAGWQGKVYSISGKAHPKESKRLGYKILSLEAVTGYPHDPAGLCGYNCKHTFYPFIEGISDPTPLEKEPEPVKVDGRTYTFYQATQYQRRLERELREFKRQYLGGQNMTAAITAKEQQYARFCEKAGLKQNLNRLYVKGYKRDFEYIKNEVASQKSKELIDIARKKDKVITKDLNSIVSESGGHLEGLNFRIKSQASLYRKLIDKSESRGISIEQYSREVSDCLRYTVVESNGDFSQTYSKIFDNLHKRGYTVVEVKNTLMRENAPYRGINTLVKDTDGYVFELQYHTPQSLLIKEQNHVLYEEARLLSTTEDKRQALIYRMMENSKSIKTPLGVERIRDIER